MRNLGGLAMLPFGPHVLETRGLDWSFDRSYIVEAVVVLKNNDSMLEKFLLYEWIFDV